MKKSILLCAALAALTACNGNSDNNKSLDYETIDVNFTLKSDLEIPEGTEFGVVALCARDGQPSLAQQTESSRSLIFTPGLQISGAPVLKCPLRYVSGCCGIVFDMWWVSLNLFRL